MAGQYRPVLEGRHTVRRQKAVGSAPLEISPSCPRFWQDIPPKTYNGTTVRHWQPAAWGRLPYTEPFWKTCRRINTTPAALSHNGYANGGRSAYQTIMIRRHALAHITPTVRGWKSSLLHMTDAASGKGRLGRNPRRSPTGPTAGSSPTPQSRETQMVP